MDIDAKLPIVRTIGRSNSSPIKELCHNHINKPSFKAIRPVTKKARLTRHNDFFNKESYYHYEEPTPEQLMEIVEYDMDEEDIAWLEIFNESNSTKHNYEVTGNEFEKIMDRLEKESYFESTRNGRDIGPEVDEDAVCEICYDGDCHNSNQILFCDMCDLAVHQECYGVPYIPEGQWHCRRCLQSPSRNVECVLCPNKGGAFKQTDDNRWAHVICALWIPEVCFANTVFLEPIDNIANIPPARWKLVCYICKQKKKGACIQCNKSKCYESFHVTCGLQAGLHMKISSQKYETPEGPIQDVRKEAYCDQHGPTLDGSNRGPMYSGDETEEEDNGEDGDEDESHKAWRIAKKKKLNLTRKVLAERRERAKNPVAEPNVKEERLVEISQLLSRRNKKAPYNFDALRQEFIAKIKGYWLTKRRQRNGVPLIRRLQVSYSNVQRQSATNINVNEGDSYRRLRYDLERARLLIGQVKKREIMKKKLFELSKNIVNKQFDIMDISHPPVEE